MDTSFKPTTGELRGTIIVDILLGLWVIVSPFVLGVPAHAAVAWSNVAVGAAVIVLAFLGGLKHGAVQGLTIPLSAWLFASAFVLTFYGLAFAWSNTLSAFALVADTALSGALRSFPSNDQNP